MAQTATGAHHDTGWDGWFRGEKMRMKFGGSATTWEDGFIVSG
jgi:hypothetical protein